MKLDDETYNKIFAEDQPDNLPIEDEEGRITVKLNKSGVVNTVFDWIGSLLTALVCVLLIMSFAFRVIDVDGTSMEPTLINTDKVIITDLFYTPHDGDVIVISHGKEYEKPLVKRVIATAGQDLQIDFDKNEVYVDGKLVDEPYIQGVTIMGDKKADEVNGIIPEGKVFVMGDNRVVSLDSRYTSVDLIDVSSIIGKAQLVVIPHTYAEGQTPGIDLPPIDFTRIRYIYQ